MEIFGITVYGLVFAVLLLAVPVYFFRQVCPSMLAKGALAVGRMALQLALVGVYLYWLFRLDSFMVNVAWLLVMAMVSAFVQCKRARLRCGVVMFPMMAGLFVSVLVVTLYLLLLVLRPDHYLSSRYVVPVAGFLLYATQTVAVSVLEAFYVGMQREAQLYDILVGNGATHAESILPFVRGAVEKSFTGLFAKMSVVGIVVLPELTLGQIIGGFNPEKAIVWTIVLLIATVTVSVLSVAVTLYVADRRSFDGYGRLRNVWTKG